MSVPPPPRPPRYAVGPVDYDAWRNGYMPPSEHVLIDQLAYRGARVIQSSESGKPDGPAYWLVVRGKANPKKIGIALMQLMEAWEDEELAVEPEPPAESGPGVRRTTPQGNPSPAEPLPTPLHEVVKPEDDREPERSKL